MLLLLCTSEGQEKLAVTWFWLWVVDVAYTSAMHASLLHDITNKELQPDTKLHPRLSTV